MPKRFVTIWFRNLRTDWFTRRRPDLYNMPFILASPDHGRMMVSAANVHAQIQGVVPGMVVADARAIIPSLNVFDDIEGLSAKLLKRLADWCIRYSPSVAIDLPDGLILDVTGCVHLWGTEMQYITLLVKRFRSFGYDIRAAMADTIGTAWAVARFGKDSVIVKSGRQSESILSLPSTALRLEAKTTERLDKLGLLQIGNFINMPRTSLRRRFGIQLLKRLDEALGNKDEQIQPVQPFETYQERLPCLEPIVTATGIEIALQQLLDRLCLRLNKEEKGLRNAIFTCYRVDGKIEKIEIGTNRPSGNSKHLFKLFEIKIDSIEPALGIELFILGASKVEDISPVQEKLWNINNPLHDTELAELLDRLAGKIGGNCIHRYLPDEHHWPERSYKLASSLDEKSEMVWKTDKLRPLQILSNPEIIEVAAPIPDYPPMLFRYKGTLHKIIKADGPERIEQEWWIQEGQHRDYYCVEDEDGHRYWLFRLGHYDSARSYKWFLHGFFA
ncbi:MAG: DNA polymerase Y family protein [Bacteroidota bacterium]